MFYFNTFGLPFFEGIYPISGVSFGILSPSVLHDGCSPPASVFVLELKAGASERLCNTTRIHSDALGVCGPCRNPPTPSATSIGGMARCCALPSAAHLLQLLYCYCYYKSNCKGYTNPGPPAPSADSSPRTPRSPRPSRDGGILSRPS